MQSQLINALEHLNTVCNSSHLHTSDEDRVTVFLRTLSKNKIELPIDEIEDWLMSHDWDNSAVKNVIKWATALSNGGRVAIKNRQLAQSEKEVWKRINV